MGLLEVVLVDDHAIVRNGLRRVLEAGTQYTVVAEAESAEGLLEICRSHLPQLVLMDLSMPGMGGFEAVRRLRSKWPGLKVIIFSIYQNPQLVQRVLQAGAQGYITKNSSSDVIIDGIESVISGKTYISPDVRDSLTADSLQCLSKPLEQLSARELDVFRKVAEGLSTEQVANKLFLSEKTVANYIAIIKKKLNISSTAEIVHVALREGLLIADNQI